MSQTSISKSPFRERVLKLAATGDYEDWRGVARKMLHEGYEMEAFNAPGLADAIDAECRQSREDWARLSTPPLPPKSASIGPQG